MDFPGSLDGQALGLARSGASSKEGKKGQEACNNKEARWGLGYGRSEEGGGYVPPAKAKRVAQAEERRDLNPAARNRPDDERQGVDDVDTSTECGGKRCLIDCADASKSKATDRGERVARYLD